MIAEAKQTIDKSALGAVRVVAIAQIFSCSLVFVLLIAWIVECFISSASDGFFSLFFSLASFIPFVLISYVVLFLPFKYIRFSFCIRKIKKWLFDNNLDTSFFWSWKDTSPGVLVIDQSKKLFFLESTATNYQRLIVPGDQITSVRVQINHEYHNSIRNSGRLMLVSKSGLGYAFGGRDKPSTYTTTLFSLRISFTKDRHGYYVEVPFGENHQKVRMFEKGILEIYVAKEVDVKPVDLDTE